jgi:peptide/nickel transport system substrate-binding protein
MKKIKKAINYLLLSLIVTMSLTGILTLRAQTTVEVPYGPYPDWITVFLHSDESTVIPMIETGDMDAWLWWLNTENTKLAEENPAIGLINAYGLYNAIELNPLNTTDNFNIFSIKEVREAMNWIIDRTYIVNDLWAGRGSEKFTYFKSVSPDYARTIDAQLALENEYAYDFEKGKAQIYDALETAGAYINQTTSKWYYKGKPIVVNCLIRIEDERLDTGDYVASQLEKLGLTTNLIHRSSGDCYLYWGVTAPSVAGDWHFYTAMDQHCNDCLRRYQLLESVSTRQYASFGIVATISNTN